MTAPRTPLATSPDVLAKIAKTFTLDGDSVLRNGRPIRHRASADKAAYRKVHIGRFGNKPVKWKLSRLKYYLATGELPPIVDHKSGQTRDDSLNNLRAATAAQNNHNRRANKNKRGGLPRAIDEPRPGRYRARVRHARRLIFVATFNSVAEAVAARDNVEKPLRGEFHRPRRKVQRTARRARTAT